MKERELEAELERAASRPSKPPKVIDLVDFEQPAPKKHKKHHTSSSSRESSHHRHEEPISWTASYPAFSGADEDVGMRRLDHTDEEESTRKKSSKKRRRDSERDVVEQSFVDPVHAVVKKEKESTPWTPEPQHTSGKSSGKSKSKETSTASTSSHHHPVEELFFLSFFFKSSSMLWPNVLVFFLAHPSTAGGYFTPKACPTQRECASRRDPHTDPQAQAETWRQRNQVSDSPPSNDHRWWNKFTIFSSFLSSIFTLTQFYTLFWFCTLFWLIYWILVREIKSVPNVSGTNSLFSHHFCHQSSLWLNFFTLFWLIYWILVLLEICFVKWSVLRPRSSVCVCRTVQLPVKSEPQSFIPDQPASRSAIPHAPPKPPNGPRRVSTAATMVEAPALYDAAPLDLSMSSRSLPLPPAHHPTPTKSSLKPPHSTKKSTTISSKKATPPPPVVATPSRPVAPPAVILPPKTLLIEPPAPGLITVIVAADSADDSKVRMFSRNKLPFMFKFWWIFLGRLELLECFLVTWRFLHSKDGNFFLPRKKFFLPRKNSFSRGKNSFCRGKIFIQAEIQSPIQRRKAPLKFGLKWGTCWSRNENGRFGAAKLTEKYLPPSYGCKYFLLFFCERNTTQLQNNCL